MVRAGWKTEAVKSIQNSDFCNVCTGRVCSDVLSEFYEYINNTGSMIELKCLKGYIFFFICAEISLNTKDIYQHFLLGASHGKSLYHSLPQGNRTVSETDGRPSATLS